MASVTATSSSTNENILTKQDVECVIEKSVGSKWKVLEYNVENYSNVNLGLMGAHRNLIVKVSRDGSQTTETQTYFLKTVPYNLKDQAKFLEDSGMFHKETSFYKFIIPELIKSSKDKSWIAQCYLTKDLVLVFENLKLKNYIVKSAKERFLDIDSIKIALSSLAKMHAASMLAEKRIGKTFLELYPELIYEVAFSLDGSFSLWYQSGVAIVTKLAENFGLNHEIVPKVCNIILEKILPSKTRRNVINHGDTWSNNFMFDGTKCALVDFQLMRYAPAMVDVGQMIYFNARKELRDKCEKELLRCYYETFSEVLKNGGMDVPSFDDILDEYEEMRVVAIVTIAIYFPIQHLGEAKLDEILKDSKGFNDLFCKDRLSLVLKAMEEDERYRKLMSSVVKELVDFAEKFV